MFIKNVARKYPGIIVSVFLILLLTPIDLHTTRVDYRSECNADPVLYLHDDLHTNSHPFVRFVDSANKTLHIMAHPLYPIAPDYSVWVEPIRRAVKRGVSVKVVTTQPRLVQILNFTDCVLISAFNQSFYLNLAVADDSRTVFASELFGSYGSKYADYYIDMHTCPSIAADALSIFYFMESFKSNKIPSVYPFRYCPGNVYPKVHKTPSGSEVIFGISPSLFASPGRRTIIDIITDFFDTRNSTISILTPSLFPYEPQPSVDMPELAISDLIENSAIYGNCSFQILMSKSEFGATANVTMSLSRMPNIQMGLCPLKGTSPSFFVQKSQSLFVPIAFQNIMGLEIISLALRIEDKSIAHVLQAHFDEIWHKNTSVPIP